MDHGPRALGGFHAPASPLSPAASESCLVASSIPFVPEVLLSPSLPSSQKEGVSPGPPQRAPCPHRLFRNLPQARNSSLRSRGGSLGDNLGLSLWPVEHGSRRHFLILCVKHPAPPRSARRKGHSCRSLRVWYGRDTAHRTLYAVTPHRTHRSERWSSSSGSGTERLGHGPHITPLVTCEASTPRPLASEPTPLPRWRAAGSACCVGGRRAPRRAPSRANALVWASRGVASTSPGGGTRRRPVYGAGPVCSKPGPPRLAFNQRSRGRGLTWASSHCLKGENSPTRTSLACSRSNVSGFVFKEFPPG